jgi:hypothetical protein
MLAVLIAAVDESSKTPFYVLAGLLVLSAVGLAAIGIRRHETFPSSDAAQRATIAYFLVLVAGTMLSAVLTA